MKIIKNKTLLFSTITLLLIAVLSTTFVWIKNNKYTYVQPKKGSLVEAIYGLGKVKSHRKYDVKIGVMTRVKKVYVKEGELVKAGEPLISFADTDVFHAPFDGTITSLPYNAPDTVLPQSTTLTMQDLNDNYLEVSLEQEGALRVAKGQKAKVLFESVRGETFEGEVIALFPKDDEFLAHIQVKGLGNNILPGMTADVSIIVGKHDNVLLVPIAGLSSGQIIIRRDGKKIKVPIKVGGIDGEWAEVVEGDIKMSDEILLKVSKTNLDQDATNAVLGN